MNLYRFKGYGWGAPSWHIVAPTFYDAWTTAEAEGIRWCEVELLASDDDAAWPKEAPKKRLIVRGLPADAEKDARIAELERKLAELTAAAEATCGYICGLKGYQPDESNTPGGERDKLRAVLDAQRGEKEEAKP